MKFTTTTCSTSLPLLAMVSTMSGKAVEARLGVGGEGRRNLNTNQHNCVEIDGYKRCAMKSDCLCTVEEPVDSGVVDVHGYRAGYVWCKSKGNYMCSFDEDCHGKQCGRRCTTAYTNSHYKTGPVILAAIQCV